MPPRGYDWRMRQLVRLLVLGFCLSSNAVGQSTPARVWLGAPQHAAVVSSTPALPAPSLIVLITIDQFRWDYLDRFGPQLRGGLAPLSRTQASFPNAHHGHAITPPAPGHPRLS